MRNVIVFIVLVLGLASPAYGVSFQKLDEKLTDRFCCAVEKAFNVWLVYNLPEIDPLPKDVLGELKQLKYNMADALNPHDSIRSFKNIRKHGGDCEDLAFYTMVRVLQQGFDAGFIFLSSYDDKTKKMVGHICVIIYVKGGYLILDPAEASKTVVFDVGAYLEMYAYHEGKFSIRGMGPLCVFDAWLHVGSRGELIKKVPAGGYKNSCK